MTVFFWCKTQKIYYTTIEEILSAEGGTGMPQVTQNLLEQYVEEIKKIYGTHLQKIILYGSYARGDYTQESDIDIMILVDLPVLH